MAENEGDQNNKKTLSLGKTLGVKKTVDSGQIRQSFSHGRSKSVTFEVKKKRSLDVTSLEADRQTKVREGIKTQTGLTEAEIESRMRILKQAQERDAEQQNRRQEESSKLAEIDARRAEELVREEQEKLERELAAKQKAEAEQQAAAVAAAAPAPVELPPVDEEGKPIVRPVVKPKEQDLEDEARKHEMRKTLSLETKKESKPKLHRLSIEEALNDETEKERHRSQASLKRLRDKRRAHGQSLQDLAPVVRDVILPEFITVQELASRMSIRAVEVVKKLMSLGVMATVTQSIDADTAELIIREYGHNVKRVEDVGLQVDLLADDAPSTLKPRAPVVTVMGHVDHGKTSLLDAIRKTDVVSGEAGGITQHIGAYQVSLKNGKKISFIDTPGHAAFSEMRARGANVTDIVVLVVAADDGIKEQTVEAISHAKAAQVPLIVAINKVDKPGSDPMRVRNELLSHELVVEDLGGDIPCVEVSAKQGLNIDKLEDTILLLAEIADLKANPDRSAVGAVVEAKVDKGRGTIATVLVQRGTLKIGDIFVAGSEWGKVRALVNDKGQHLKEAGPSLPIEVLGFSASPVPGDTFLVVEDEAKAREIAEFRAHRDKERKATAARKASLEQIFNRTPGSDIKELALIIKSDVQGSAEAIMGSLNKIESDEVKVRILHNGVGGINESDVTLAQASHAMIIGFNVRANNQARDAALKAGVEIRYYSIIYNVIDDIKGVMSGLLKPKFSETFLGYAEIRQVFNITKVGKVAGCYVTSGVVKRGAKVRLLRDNVVIHEGVLKTLKRVKEEVREVKESYECGMAFENYNDIREGDVIECFEVESITRSIDGD